MGVGGGVGVGVTKLPKTSGKKDCETDVGDGSGGAGSGTGVKVGGTGVASNETGGVGVAGGEIGMIAVDNGESSGNVAVAYGTDGDGVGGFAVGGAGNAHAHKAAKTTRITRILIFNSDQPPTVYGQLTSTSST